MQIPLTPDDDPTIAIVRAAAQASLEASYDELVRARRAARLALDEIPTLTFDWFGTSSEAYRVAATLLQHDVRAVRDPLVGAVAAIAGELP